MISPCLYLRSLAFGYYFPSPFPLQRGVMTEWLLASSQCRLTTVMKVGWDILRCSWPRHPSATAVSLHLPTVQHWLWAFEMQLCSIQDGMDEPSLSSVMLKKELWSSKTYQPNVCPRTSFYHTLLSFSLKTETQRQGLSPAWDAEPLQMGRMRRRSISLIHLNTERISCTATLLLLLSTALFTNCNKAPEGL